MLIHTTSLSKICSSVALKVMPVQKKLGRKLRAFRGFRNASHVKKKKVRRGKKKQKKAGQLPKNAKCL